MESRAHLEPASSSTRPSPTERVIRLWERLRGLPFGQRLFAFLIGRQVPYSGTIRPLVLELSPGRARIAIDDRRKVRNHLRSVHAIALANLGELTSGLAFSSGMPADARGIPRQISIEYVKKARGRIIAEADCEPPADNRRQDYEVEARLTDATGDLVATFKATWVVGPR